MSCGCISQNPLVFEKNSSQFADEVRASQSYYDNLVREDPLNAAAWCLRGNYYNNAFNQYNKALESYNRSLELDPEYGNVWFSKGVTLQNMRYYDEAKVCFEKALRYDPSLSSVIARLER
jgi:tetratricopeptide (TPR) repeat protein